ncbi:2OG-Fe(II) oxygenase [Joostella sp. CR20]|uniref:2OG-Fe(II) oxygenase n=1 Tax=Joostella sp. CR20 TaxID=2804312 RepID=UPI00313AEA61
MEELFDQLDFVENPLFESIIDDLLEQQYSVIDTFFSEEEVTILRTSLLEKYEEDKFKKAAIGNKFEEQIIKSIRGDFVLWIDEQKQNPAEALFFKKINQLVNYLNKTCFLGILHKEFHYAVYPEGTFYKRHLDTFQNDDRRKLSFVCYLNDQDWKNENGGELVIYKDENGTETAKSLYPLPGRVVIFESQLLEHEVKPVLASERYSITGWLKTR